MHAVRLTSSNLLAEMHVARPIYWVNPAFNSSDCQGIRRRGFGNGKRSG